MSSSAMWLQCPDTGFSSKDPNLEPAVTDPLGWPRQTSPVEEHHKN
eukprot:CAMPEP_0194763472 /NCGR_PEP_ID=MMETSP0323_2-20130528/19474_1 /TAXON_ID=2866 ORGANISM="Crypthecodinium cohnii, Strain Seligo" /NCGR_SAMPLE_ID=MMETSP0323_2 /ASSEMBLY_ACC=CAM_ASM_000346 /LENGTH=45 /DNA_ID= /DNA_START= /DNA_END= /DNA_ORIENTATION=